MNNDIRAYREALAAANGRDRAIGCYWKGCSREAVK